MRILKLTAASVLVSASLLLSSCAASGQVSSDVSTSPFQGIKGTPYCAVEETENFQTLSDGTHIRRVEHRSKVCRDSEGRTRREEFFPSASETPTMVNIFDPVGKVIYFLNPRAQTATRATIPSSVISRSSGADANASTGTFGASVGGGTGEPPKPALRPQSLHEDIGTQEIDGIYTVGSRVTTAWPVGTFGNDRPVLTVCEEWKSPELKVVVLRTCSDPRNGDTTTRLKNVDRGEPDPALFQPPSDYKIVEQTTH